LKTTFPQHGKEDFEIFDKIFFEQHEYKEVAEFYNLPVGAIKSKVRKIKKLLLEHCLKKLERDFDRFG